MYSRDNAAASSTGEMPSMYYCIYLNSLHMKKINVVRQLFLDSWTQMFRREKNSTLTTDST